MEPPSIRSRRCLGAVNSAQGILPCTRCQNLSVDIDVIKERAERNYKSIRSDEALNNVQIREKLSFVREQENSLKLKNVNLSDSLNSARQCLSNLDAVFQFVGWKPVPALHRIFSNAVKQGWSAKKLLEKLQLAHKGEYDAKNYTQYEIDLTILVYELGGGGAVYALNHSIFALPSLSTIQPYRRQHTLSPCIDRLRITDISNNISALFGPHKAWNGTKSGAIVEREHIICGHTLSFDEIAMERKIDYMTATDEMGGMCLEHVGALRTVKVGQDTSTVEAAVEAVREGKVHIGHEASVGAISRLYQTGYGAKPVFIGASCKRGDWKDCFRTMETVIEAWRRSADGEIKHGPILSVASDGDPKRRAALFVMTMHSEILADNPIYRYICKLPGLNRRVGKDNLTMDPDWKHMDKRWASLWPVKSVCINRDLLLTWFERLPSHDWSETSIHALLDPSDAQDVPRAIKLLLCIVELQTLDSEDFDPSELVEFEALCLFGEAIDALLQPFINTELTLSEQIESLVRFAHLICALYLENGPSFLPNQLYGDLQAMVKNAVLMVPKTRIINGQLKVYICLLGDDVLEALFGRSRMIGGHSPNSSLGELRDRFNSAMNLDYIYEQHPELERKPRRLKLFRMRDVDHLPDSCDLEACWTRAVSSAEYILRKYGVQMCMSFAQLFQMEDTDLMRPNGGRYPSVSTSVDRSMADLSSGQTEAVGGIDPETMNPSSLTIDFDAMIACEAAQRVAESSAEPHSVFATIDDAGHAVHKKSILRTLFDMTHDNRSSPDRLARLGNIFATMISHNGSHLSLAIAKCTLIKQGPSGAKSASTSAIPLGELHLPSSPYTISGQIFSLIPIPSTSNPNPGKWAWDGDFITLLLTMKGAAGKGEASRINNLQFSVPSRLIDPIHNKAEETLAFDITVPCKHEKTWLFSDADILQSWYRLYNRILGDRTLHDKFPKFTGVSDGSFPYEISPSAGKVPRDYLFRTIANTAIGESNISRHTCRICQKPVKDTDRQTHVGHHILKAFCGVVDESAKSVSVSYPCGLCGGPTSDGACNIRIKGGKADSDCPSAYPFLISAASQFRESRPCTNVPVACPLNCNETHWKYNFQQHLQERHPTWEQIISPNFFSQIQVT
ncbi:hypothetical protein DFH07DRAFT_867598 [Mycena maculata]|uniref:Uncharacterized protein n=1 Tax=Mycena maculata TaxID=230809 RepID=A0AAD7JEQ4_9AGAR|nr:hypothetical protein DFH07DRAFT_867598 [Mycena maculata]